tara:strand:- start:243 stop:569 length:327 start_codon:yes stop_codon:yes gene_type:complete
VRTVSQVSDEVIEKALDYLTDTDEEFGRQSAYVKMAPYYLKLIKAQHFLIADGTVAERESRAYASTAYETFVEKLDETMTAVDIMEAKRESAQREIDIWRTISANQRK